MNIDEEPYYKTWLWIPKVWLITYGFALLVAVLSVQAFGPESYRMAIGVVVFGLGIPLTFKSLVGAGCDVRFQICALVKGMISGVAFLVLTFIVDPITWSVASQFISWTPLSNPTELWNIQQIWIFAGLFGGFAARVVEVRRITSGRKREHETIGNT